MLSDSFLRSTKVRRFTNLLVRLFSLVGHSFVGGGVKLLKTVLPDNFSWKKTRPVWKMLASNRDIFLNLVQRLFY